MFIMDVAFLISGKPCARHIKGHVMTPLFQLSVFFYLMSSDSDGGFNEGRRRERPLEISVTFLLERKTDRDKESPGNADVWNTGVLVKLQYQKKQR